ncbi:UDP-glycosyltransferase 83A1, partial [Mucuna pruriens]
MVHMCAGVPACVLAYVYGWMCGHACGCTGVCNYICDELKVGLGLNSDENRLVSRWEIKKKLDQLISDEQIRTRCLELKETVINNIAEGGGSSKNISRFVNWLKS